MKTYNFRDKIDPVITKDGFDSIFEHVGQVELPEYTGLRVMMLPVVIADGESLPSVISKWRQAFEKLCATEMQHKGKVGYLTIDEKEVKPGETHRRPEKHVDGVYNGVGGVWGGAGGGTWGSVGNGMLTVSSAPGCRAWRQWFDGWPGSEGEAEHLSSQCREENCTLFGANEVYWLDGLCVHESVPFTKATKRQFVRLSLPSNGAWFEGYTVNPLGVMPTGPILPYRQFMNQ